jgi:hypothetical protein
MGLSIPRQYPGRVGPPGECRRMCDYCGHQYYRSTMVRDPSGRLACTDGNCHTGRDEVTLNRENAAAASESYDLVPGGDW